MRLLHKMSLLLVLVVFLSTSVGVARDKDKDKDKKKDASGQVNGPSKVLGACTLGTASKDLDVNNVRARLYNNGGLFWKGSGNVYTVPKDSESNAVFASGIWLGGIDPQGNLRFAGTTYGPFEYWPGPLDANGNPPADCSVYDRIYIISIEDLNAIEDGRIAPDVRDWPWQLGAPVRDGDSNPNNYNLAGGDRPAILGHQMAWWVMNDAGGEKGWSKTNPMGLEVQVTAFAFNTSNALNNTTFYKYRIEHKGPDKLSDMYMGLWSDPDLGDATNDYVASDTTLGLGIVYNGTDFDAGADGYGSQLPALAYDFFQGPLVPATGQTFTDPDGTVHENATRLKMTNFLYYNNNSNPVNGNPTGTSRQPYDYMRNIWRDGTPVTFGKDGTGGTVPTNFMFPGDPSTRAYWSEENTDGNGARNTPADRRFLMSAGPFDMNPGDVQEIVYGIVWSMSSTGDRLASVAQVKIDDLLAQAAFDANFDLPPPPDRPIVEISELDGQAILTISNRPSSNNYIENYDVFDKVLAGQPIEDSTYTFEGYKIYRFDSARDNEGQLIKTMDVVNGVKTITDKFTEAGADVFRVVATGTDSGIEHSVALENLTNYKTYRYGVQAYAYSPHSSPRTLSSSMTTVEFTPMKLDARGGGSRAQSTYDSHTFVGTVTKGLTGNVLTARIVDPAAVTGDTYQMEFYRNEDVITYDLKNLTTGEVLMDGRDYYDRNQDRLPTRENHSLGVFEGLEFRLEGPPDPDFEYFLTVANGAGPLDPFDMAAFAFNSSGFPSYEGHFEPQEGQMSTVASAAWGITAERHTNGGQLVNYPEFIDLVTGGGDFYARKIVPYDFEMRFTAEGSIAYDIGCTNKTMQVPFELWRIGAATPNDPSDDVRMVPYVLDNDKNGQFNLQVQSVLNALPGGGCAHSQADHRFSGGTNDPYTDWFFWATPDDETPGQAGYQAWKTAALALGGGDNGAFYNKLAKDNSMRNMVLGSWNGGTVTASNAPANYNMLMPEQGTIFRIVTKKPSGPGVQFQLSTAGYERLSDDAEVAKSNLDQIGIVPNPYKGTSAYETSPVSDEVRFTNLPDDATIRVFNLAGTLVKTLRLSSFNNTWNLKAEDGLSIASGMYLVHVEVPGVGEKVIKFGVVVGRTQIDLF